VKPTVLLVTTKNWVPTARLAMALANAGFRVEALCPHGHPLTRIPAASRIHVYKGLTPERSLVRAIAATKPDLIVPGDDLATRHLHEVYRLRESYSGIQNEIGTLIQRSLGSPEGFAVALARAAFMQLAHEEGIRVPKTEILKTSDDVQNVVEHVGLPAVLKADGTSGGEGVQIVRASAEAQQAFRKLHAAPLLARAFKRAALDQDSTLVWPSLLRRRPTMSAQSFVAGCEATSTVACWQGTVLASLHFEVLRKSHAAGHATVVRLIEHSEISNAVEKVVRRMRLSGLYGFDFMVETSTGNAYLIEINPRSTQVGHLTLGRGHDLPAALYAAVTGQSIRVAAALTEKDTIALFPHEWARDPRSEFLQTAYHDVPWDVPELVSACIRRSGEQSKWYARANRSQGVPAEFASMKPSAESAVRFDCNAD